MPPERPLRLFLVAGEPSGDALGGRLIRALVERAAPRPVVFAGVGGERMREAGLDSLFPQRDLAVMGLVEVLPRLPLILSRLRRTAAAVRDFRPDVVVTIDSGGFNKPLARRLIRQGESAWRVHYVAPMVWAWRADRVHSMAACFDRLLALFPFEPPWFERAGLPTEFVGHPVVEAPAGDGPALRRRLGIQPAATVLAVLPGSRPGEVRRLLPVFGETVARLARGRGPLHVLVPTVETVAAEVARAVAGWPVPAVALQGEAEKRDAFAASDAALAASGTVALELAWARVPTVVAYRVHPMTAWMVRRLLTVRHASLPNILLDRPLLPELLQDACRADRLVPALAALLDDPAAAAAQQAGFAEMAARLAVDGLAPSHRAADAILSLAAHPRSTTPSVERTVP